MCAKNSENSKYEIYVPYDQIAHAISFEISSVTIENFDRLHNNWTDYEFEKHYSGIVILFNYPTDLSDQVGKLVTIYITINFNEIE